MYSPENGKVEDGTERPLWLPPDKKAKPKTEEKITRHLIEAIHLGGDSDDRIPMGDSRQNTSAGVHQGSGIPERKRREFMEMPFWDSCVSLY